MRYCVRMPALTLSVVIPVYNEEKYLKRCIDALLDQGESVNEIVIVDNNSSDESLSILKKYAEKFEKIKVISESAPGVVHARNAGFKTSTGSMIGRIDADTVVSAGWAKTIIEFFESHEDVSAATGLSYLYETPISNYRTRSIDRQIERGKIKDGRSLPMLQGNNMAIRREVWDSVRKLLDPSDELHEDIDLTMCFDSREARDRAVAGNASGNIGSSQLDVTAGICQLCQRIASNICSTWHKEPRPDDPFRN